MLQLIDEGNITGCADFVIERAIDRESYGSILAARILAKQKNTKALRRVANDLLAATPPLSADRTPALTAILFPSVLKMQDILELITRTRPARRYQVEGYRNELQHFFENARNKTDRDALLGKLADFAAKPPLEDWPKVSKEYHTLLTKCGDLARAAITRSDKEGIELKVEERAVLLKRAVRHYDLAANDGNWDGMIIHLRKVIVLDPPRGGKLLADLLSENSKGKRRERAKALLKSNFSRHHGSLIAPYKFGPALLAQLTMAAYSLFSKGGVQSDDDDYHGDDPRDAFLNSLVQMDGEEAFLAVRSLSSSKSMAHLSHRMIELSNEIAERSAHRVAWSAAAVRQYEVSKLASIVTGNDLFELVRDLLIFIQWRFINDDLSPRGVVETAVNEAAVQEWLGSNLEDLGKERFKANREARVAGEKRPDLIITSNTAPFEVAIELKHDEMHWTYLALQGALHQQLVEQYLLPADRRHGLLVISNHRNKKFWIDKQDGHRISFNEVIKRLNQEASKITRNSAGLVRVAVVGLDAAPRVRKVAPEKDSGTLV